MPKKTHPQLQLIKPEPNLHTIHFLAQKQLKYSSKTPQAQRQSLPNINPEHNNYSIILSRKNQKIQGQANTSQTLNSAGEAKINAVVNLTNSKKNQIMLLKARINNLRQHRLLNEKRVSKNVETVNQISSTRERVNQKQKFQSFIAQRRDAESSLRKTRTNKFRIQIKKQLEKAKKKIQQQKIMKAQEQRQIRKQDEDFIQEQKQMEKQEKILKAKTVKKFEEEHHKKMHSFYETSRARSYFNHLSRFNNHMTEKNKVDSILTKLQKEEEKLKEQALLSDIMLREAQEKLKIVVQDSRVRSMTRSGCRSQSSNY